MNNLTKIKEKIGEWVNQHKDEVNAYGTKNYCVDGEHFYIYLVIGFNQQTTRYSVT